MNAPEVPEVVGDVAINLPVGPNDTIRRNGGRRANLPNVMSA